MWIGFVEECNDVGGVESLASGSPSKYSSVVPAPSYVNAPKYQTSSTICVAPTNELPA